LDNIVNINSYYGLADFKWGEKPGIVKDLYVVQVSMTDIPQFFQFALEDGKDFQFVVVTPPSDHSICYQEGNTINDNMVKFFQYNYDQILENAALYRWTDNISFAPRGEITRCDKKDKYAIKIDSYTFSTHQPEMPDNIVKWYSPNCNIKDDRIVHTPFGVNNSPEMFPESAGCAGIPFEDKLDRLYINFSDHTIDRVNYKKYFRDFDWTLTVDKEPRGPGIAPSEFLNHIDNSKFVLCPRGLGLDCFRTWETLHYGSIPVLEREFWNEWMEDYYPVILLDSFYDITSIEYLLLKYKEIEYKCLFPSAPEYNNRYLTESFWRKTICQHVVPEKTNPKPIMEVPST